MEANQQQGLKHINLCVGCSVSEVNVFQWKLTWHMECVGDTQSHINSNYLSYLKHLLINKLYAKTIRNKMSEQTLN